MAFVYIQKAFDSVLWDAMIEILKELITYGHKTL